MSKLSYTSPEQEGVSTGEEQLVQEAKLFAENRSAARMNRRRLLTNLGLAAGAAGVLGVAGCSDDGTAPIPSPTTTPSVVDVLNFALNLEYFEASLYSYIVTGSGLSSADMGSSPGTVTGGAKVTFQYSAIANIAANLMAEEVQHVEFLRSAITSAGGTPISMPSLNLVPATAYAITNDQTFVSVARTIEAVGVSAYEGAAQYLTSAPSVLTFAASIHDLEAQHEGALRQACIYFPGGSVTSAPADSMDIPPTTAAIFNTNPSTGLNTVRTVSQVLQIVYATPGVTGTTKGGFFPNGLNGNLYMS
ncbi:MAG TPA: ferritin-like domain-containing protein [Acidobacteriaceae bacterium]|nr:ferritin-like domain-containing protein [Acidobacteriaceae bacterium]